MNRSEGHTPGLRNLPHEMHLPLNMFRLVMKHGIVDELEGGLRVRIDNGGIEIPIAKLLQEGCLPDSLAGRLARGIVLRLAGGQRHALLPSATPADSGTTEEEHI